MLSFLLCAAGPIPCCVLMASLSRAGLRALRGIRHRRRRKSAAPRKRSTSLAFSVGPRGLFCGPERSGDGRGGGSGGEICSRRPIPGSARPIPSNRSGPPRLREQRSPARAMRFPCPRDAIPLLAPSDPLAPPTGPPAPTAEMAGDRGHRSRGSVARSTQDANGSEFRDARSAFRARPSAFRASTPRGRAEGSPPRRAPSRCRHRGSAPASAERGSIGSGRTGRASAAARMSGGEDEPRRPRPARSAPRPSRSDGRPERAARCPRRAWARRAAPARLRLHRGCSLASRGRSSAAPGWWASVSRTMGKVGEIHARGRLVARCNPAQRPILVAEPATHGSAHGRRRRLASAAT